MAYRELLDFYSSEYLPGARGTTAAADLPRGREYYRHLVRSFTTLEVTPEEVHQIGHGEVARIRGGNGSRHPQDRFQRRLRRLPGFPAHRPALLRKNAPTSC